MLSGCPYILPAGSTCLSEFGLIPSTLGGDGVPVGYAGSHGCANVRGLPTGDSRDWRDRGGRRKKGTLFAAIDEHCARVPSARRAKTLVKLEVSTIKEIEHFFYLLQRNT
jgi:hypothetical protein